MTDIDRRADVLCIKGTWTDTSAADAWTKPRGVLAKEVLDVYGWRVLRHEDEWDGSEHGLLIQQAVGLVTGRDDGRDWEEAGNRLAGHIYELCASTAPLRADGSPTPIVIMAHSHGNQVVAHALDFLRGSTKYPDWIMPSKPSLEQWRRHRPVFWLAIDPPVRMELNFVYNSALVSLRLRNAGYHGLAGNGGFAVQTRSSGKNWRSWPRYLGARHWPWDRSVIGEHTYKPALLIYQPGGHSDVLRRPERHLEWWDGTVRRVDDVFNGGTPVLPS